MSLTKVTYSMISGDVVNVLDFGADPTGVNDSRAAINAAIASLNAVPTTTPNGVDLGGGTVYIPEGTYKISGDALNNGIQIPCNTRLIGAGIGATRIIPAGNNVVCIKVYASYSEVSNLLIINDGAYSNVSGLRVAPLNETAVTYTQNDYGKFHNLEIRGCNEGIVAKPGPNVPGVGDAACWYNHFFDISVRDCTIGVGLYGAGTYGPNRNVFTNVRIGGTETQYGLFCDLGDTCKFIACSFEGIQTSPGVAIYLSSKALNGKHVFYSPTFEACTLNIESHTPLWSLICPLGFNASISGTYGKIMLDETYMRQENAYHLISSLYANTAIGAGGTTNPLTQYEGFGSNNKAQAAQTLWSIRSNDSDATRQVLFAQLGNASGYAGFQAFDMTGPTPIDLALQYSSGHVRPGQNNVSNLGTASYRWKEVFAVNGTINTSDVRDKEQVRSLNDAEKAVAVRLKSLLKAFKWKDAVEEKDEEARIHFGVIAQEVKEAFEAEGLVAEKYALLCYDEWDDVYEPVTEQIKYIDENGVEKIKAVDTGEKTLVRAAGNRYGVRYTELLAFIIGAL